MNKAFWKVLTIICIIWLATYGHCAADISFGDNNNKMILNNQLLDSASKGDVDAVREFLEQGADPNAQNKYGDTVLMQSAFSDSCPNIVNVLIRGGANVNAIRMDNGGTALLYAATNGTSDCVKALLAGRARVDIQDKRGETALFGAVHNQKMASVKALLAAGANVHHRNIFNMPPLMIAAIRGPAAFVDVLIKAGADVNAAVDKKKMDPKIIAELGNKASEMHGKTALMMAVTDGQIEKAGVVKLLLTAGANINSRDSQGNTALSYAMKKNDTTIIRLIKEAEKKGNVRKKTLSPL